MSKKELVQFITTLSDLMNSDLELNSALEIMSQMSGLKKNCNSAALEIKKYLSEGSKFSIALKKCQSINFDEVFIAFICSAEKSGDLKSTIMFLKKREQEKMNRKNKILGMSIYPAFVVFISFAGGLILSFYATTLVADINGSFNFAEYKKNVAEGMFSANLFLLCFVCAFIYVLQNMISKNILLDVFKIIDFMMKSNVGFYSALETSLLIADKNTKIKNQILKSITDISSGEKIGKVINNFGNDFTLFVQVAEFSGNLSNAFNQICLFLENKMKEKEKIYLELINPIIMCVTGLYIVILLKKVAMPVLFNFGI